MAAPKQTDPQFKLRMTPEIKERIELAASEKNRSMNAEIVSRLEDSFHGSVADGKEIIQALLMSEDTPKDNPYRKAIELRALLYCMGAPEQELLAALQTVNRLRGLERDYANEGLDMVDRLERNLRPLLDTLADYMRGNGWQITPPDAAEGETE